MASAVKRLQAGGKVAAGAAAFILAWANDHMDLVPVQYRGYVTGVIGLLGLLGIWHAPYVSTAGLRTPKRKTRKQAGTSQVPIVRDAGKHEAP